jgi:hypothetical protein
MASTGLAINRRVALILGQTAIAASFFTHQAQVALEEDMGNLAGL